MASFNVSYTFTLHVVDAEEPNAFALPGGYIYVSRGLLALACSEDELAGVLWHEISCRAVPRPPPRGPHR